jgi:hypothetical protein
MESLALMLNRFDSPMWLDLLSSLGNCKPQSQYAGSSKTPKTRHARLRAYFYMLNNTLPIQSPTRVNCTGLGI